MNVVPSGTFIMRIISPSGEESGSGRLADIRTETGLSSKPPKDDNSRIGGIPIKRKWRGICITTTICEAVTYPSIIPTEI